MRKWVADFETTTKKRKEYDGTCHVWAVGLCEVGNPDNIIILKTMNEFIEWCQDKKNNDMVYFHNIRFDGNFIIQWLFKNGYEHITQAKDKKDKTFTTIINEKGLWYEIEIFFSVNKNRVNKVTFRDSLKLIPLSVEDIAREFRLPIQKGRIDYSAHDFLPEGSDITEEEKDYLIKDLRIVEHALNFFQQNGLTKMTIGACAMSEFKGIMGEKNFKMYFPVPFYDAEVREAYRGGFTYLDPKFKNKDIKKDMIVLDVNSLYPSVMAGCDGEIVPYGTPIYYEGKYEHDDLYCLYVQTIRCSFKLKPNKIPTIYIKNDWYFQGGQSYLTTSDEEEITLHLTSVDLELFLEQYDVYNLEYLHGWKFKGKRAADIFGKYVMRWSNIKIKAKEDGNWGMYLIAKLFLNTLYGKFGSATHLISRIPYIGSDGKMHFKEGEVEKKDGVYIAMACFITAYARLKTIKAAQTIKDNYAAGKSKIQFVYADTDSLHCISPGFKMPEGLSIHHTELGAWDHEASAVRGKFIRQKCYMEKHIITEKQYKEAMEDDRTVKEVYSIEDGNYYYTKITIAGMPDSCYKNVTFENFQVGASYPGKLSHTMVDGGVILEDMDFTIKK